MGDLNGWYEGFVIGALATNNGLEAINRTIKDNYTFRDRLPFRQFLTKSTEIVENWSADLAVEMFQTSPRLGTKEWTMAWQWAQEPTILHLTHDSGVQQYFIKPANSKATAEEFEDAVDAYKIAKTAPGGYGSWDNYAKLRESVWILTTDGTTEVCTCPMFLKKGACKHSLGVKIILGQVEVPPHATSVPLGQKRKRGRPKKAGAALMRD